MATIVDNVTNTGDVVGGRRKMEIYIIGTVDVYVSDCAEPVSNMDQYDHYNTGLVLAHYSAESGFSVSLENDTSHLPEVRRHDYGL